MPIDFHSSANRNTYAGRVAGDSWRAAMREIVDPAGLDVVDVGCGAGVYSRAWLDLGAATVTGIDFSVEMLSAAAELGAGRANLTFARGDAAATGLAESSADLVFERALVHHVTDMGAVVREAARLLRGTGTYIIQDRTAADVREPGSSRNLRGHIIERVPRLLEIELRRRPRRDAVVADLRGAGFGDVTTRSLWEVRKTYPSGTEYLDEIRARTGRSILHELTEDELDSVVEHLAPRLPRGEIVEADRWDSVDRSAVMPTTARAERDELSGTGSQASS